ncbi:MAG TPA: fumarylacetoacetate hydrolase family protein [Vicinamibacteria bacterium]
MKLYKTARGPVAEEGSRLFLLDVQWDDLVAAPGLGERLRHMLASRQPLHETSVPEADCLAPIGAQEVWAAGVTYYRSRDARIEESKGAGGGDFYARVYDADRPELFFKASPFRVRGPGQPLRIRRDARWNVPEPELALVISKAGTIEGYTVGDDMSSRDIEGENPLYLPQAKVYDGSCGLGPCVLVAEGAVVLERNISLEIRRGGVPVFEGASSLTRLKRRPEELVAWLYRESSFPHGCVLLTGTGIVPPNDFTLEPGDEAVITIDGIGTLRNPVERAGGA